MPIVLGLGISLWGAGFGERGPARRMFVGFVGSTTGSGTGQQNALGPLSIPYKPKPETLNLNPKPSTPNLTESCNSKPPPKFRAPHKPPSGLPCPGRSAPSPPGSRARCPEECPSCRGSGTLLYYSCYSTGGYSTLL